MLGVKLICCTILQNGQDARSTKLNFIVERASCPFNSQQTISKDIS